MSQPRNRNWPIDVSKNMYFCRVVSRCMVSGRFDSTMPLALLRITFQMGRLYTRRVERAIIAKVDHLALSGANKPAFRVPLAAFSISSSFFLITHF